MIDHTNHDHPSTPAARALCRRTLNGSIHTSPRPGEFIGRMGDPTRPTAPANMPHTPRSIATVNGKALGTNPWRPAPALPADVDKELEKAGRILARNRARFTSTPVPTPAQREEALVEVLLHLGTVKGSKSVHVLVRNTVDILRCTNHQSKDVFVQSGHRSDVTCKNCQRILNVSKES